MKVRKTISEQDLQDKFEGRLDLYFNFITSIYQMKGEVVYEIKAKKKKENFIVTIEL